ncbi:MAG: hypothetical protein GXY46_03825 [Actinobacteria bacterium]|nr:hypothetical protein [Actinomycetota bacterium]
MTVEYIVLGVLLVVMGAVQTWLRHGPGGKALRAEQEALAQRRAPIDAAAKAEKRGQKVWTSWTAILGLLSMALGVVLLVLGVLGR